MKVSPKTLGSLAVVLGLLPTVLLLTACGPLQPLDPAFTEVGGSPAGAPDANPASSAPSAPSASNGGGTEILRPGDPLVIVFSDLPPSQPMLPFQERIKDDGTITLIYNQSFLAAGKTRGDLEREIRATYVPKYFLNLTVNVNTLGRFYYVGGEVKQPGEKPYLANMTVTKAIQAAGDFTYFANKKKVQLTRSNGQVLKVNCSKAQNDPRFDWPVYAGDKIHVPRRLW